MFKPINRTRVQVADNRFRLYPKAGPLFYKKPDGTYGDIDHTFNDTTSSIGDISLMDKGVVSVGKRKGNNPTKVVGIRPDNNQHLGTQQLEFSLINVELDGESQSFNVETDLEIKLRASKVFQLVKINKDFNDFKVEFDIHSTGLELQNNKYSQTTTLRDYGFNLNNIGNIDSSNTDATLNNIFSEDRTIPYIDCCISKITNDYITTGEYSSEEEFGDSDLSDYIIDDSVYPNGSSIYYKDCIMLVSKSHNIENIEDIFVNQMCSKYGLSTIFEDNKNGQYFTKDNKKVAGYYSDGDTFFMFINTKEISSDIKELFKRKTFESTSYLDITLDDFSSDLNDMFNKNLTLELDTNYYEPIGDSFSFNMSNENMLIGKPILFDKDYNIISTNTTHSLKDNEDGSYRYTKYFSTEGYLTGTDDIKYIDATLYVSETQDQSPYYTSGLSSGVKKTSGNLTAIRNATSKSNYIALGGTDAGAFICGDLGTKTAGQTTNYLWNVYQQHYTFDSSGISGTVSSLVWNHLSAYITTGGSHDDISIILLKSTATVNDGAANWNEFTGHTSGWDADDVTEYSDEFVFEGDETADTSIGNFAVEEIPLNSDAESDISDDDTFKFATVDYDQYYLDSIDTSYGNSATGRRMMYGSQIDHSDTSKRPYLEYTVGAASGYSHDVSGIASGDIVTINGIATANISKVNGA